MAYRSDKEQLPGFLDDRFKILPCQIERLLWLHENTDMSYAELAKRFTIAKSTAYYICNPDRYANKLKKDKGRKRMDRKELVARVLKSRKKKHDLFKSIKEYAIQSQVKNGNGGDQSRTDET